MTLSSATSQHLSLDHKLVLAYSCQLSAYRSCRLLQRCTRQCWPVGYLHVWERLTKALSNALSLSGREGREGLGCRDTILLLRATAVGEEVSVSADRFAVLGTLC